MVYTTYSLYRHLSYLSKENNLSLDEVIFNINSVNHKNKQLEVGLGNEDSHLTITQGFQIPMRVSKYSLLISSYREIIDFKPSNYYDFFSLNSKLNPK